MFKKLFDANHRSKHIKKIAAIPKRTGKELKARCLTLFKEYPPLAESYFYSVYLNEVMLDPMSDIFEQKVHELEVYFDNSLNYQMQLASISLSISEQNGLLGILIQFWISFCTFQLKKIAEDSEKTKEEKSQGIKNMFHKEFFLLCFYIFNICLYLYEKPFANYEQFCDHQLFSFVRDNITAAQGWKKVHNIVRHNATCVEMHFSEKQIKQNIAQLEKLCQFSKIPIPFMDTSEKLREFWSQCVIESKIIKAVKLIQTLKKEIDFYRQQNKMKQNYLICADDVFTVLTFVMWRAKKNIFGACSYIEIVLCCEYEEIKYQNLASELKKFHEDARHAYETIESVSKIGMLAPEQEILIQ